MAHVAAWAVTRRSESDDALGPDWQRIIRRNAPQEGPVDSRWLGIAGELGIDLIYAIAYAPWSKGTLERFFGRFEDQHGKTYVTYCGNSTVNRPECLEDIRRGYTADQRRRLKKLHGDEWRKHAMLKFIDQGDIPTLEDFRKGVGLWMESYHRSPHRGLHGATPLSVWQTARSVRRSVDDDLLSLMNVRGVYRVGANGVRVTVGSGPIGYGKDSAALKPYVGRDVLILLNPDDVSHCWAFTPDRDKRSPIGRLDPNKRIPPNTCADDVREAIAEEMRGRSVMHKARRSSARRTRTMHERITEHSRAVRAELIATGTDAVDQTPVIAAVQTGFEGVSRPDRTGFDPSTYAPSDPGDLEDLFDDDHAEGEADDDEGMEALFDNDPITDDADDGLEALL